MFIIMCTFLFILFSANYFPLNNINKNMGLTYIKVSIANFNINQTYF